MTDSHPHPDQPEPDDTPPPSEQPTPDAAEPRPSSNFEVLSGVSRRLRKSLEPVQPSTRFRSRLRQQIADNVEVTRAIIRREARRRKITAGVLGVGCLGSLVLLVGLTAITLRILQAIFRLVFRRQPAIEMTESE